MREFLRIQWKSLEGTGRIVGELKTVGIGVSGAAGPLMIGLDSNGRRHLVVPMPEDATIRRDSRSRGIKMRPVRGGDGGRAAVLQCTNAQYWRAFDDLIIAIALRAQEGETSELSPGELLASWRAALAQEVTPLSRAEVQGIWGELAFMLDLPTSKRQILAAWTAKDSAQKDFTFERYQVEVKTTTSVSPRRITIATVEQLEPTQHALYLHVNFVQVDPNGRSTKELCDALIAEGVDAHELADALLRRGMDQETMSRVDDLRWSVKERAVWHVAAGFPSITRGSFGGALPPGVLGLKYDIDLDSVWAERLSPALAAIMGLERGETDEA